MLWRLASKTKKSFLMVHFSYLSYPQNALLQNVLLLNILLKIRPVYIFCATHSLYKTSSLQDILLYKILLQNVLRGKNYNTSIYKTYFLSDFTSKDVINHYICESVHKTNDTLTRTVGFKKQVLHKLTEIHVLF
jgi:hypothetical protein